MAVKVRYKNSPTRYGHVGRLLHWTSVALLVTLVVTADQFSGTRESAHKTALIMQHASWGMVFLLVMLLRFYWRSINFNPVCSYSIPEAQKFAAVFLHRTIYFVVITQSLIGLTGLYFSGHGMSFFNVFDLPALTTRNESLSEITKAMHYALSVVIYPLLATHIGAALYHQLFGEPDE